MRLNYAIVFVSDMTRSVAFYRDVIGLPLKFDSPEWSELATDGATVALHKADGSAGADGGRRSAGQCRPGLSVPDLDAFHRRMAEHNVVCTRQPEDLFGSRSAQYLDPDGLEISVSEEHS